LITVSSWQTQTKLDHLEGNDQGELCVWSKLATQHDFNSEQVVPNWNRAVNAAVC